MQTRECDIKYCGVREEVIENAKPVLNQEVLVWYHLYLKERHEVYKKKEIEKTPAPWTEDEVLRDFRFTNVRRELDRESLWLIENISENDSLTMEEKVLWSILFRTFNKSETFRIMQLPHTLSIVDIDDDVIDSIREFVVDYSQKNPKYVWFTNAFNTGGLKYANAIPSKIKEKAYLNQRNLVVHVNRPDGEPYMEMEYREARDFCSANEGYFIKEIEKVIPVRMFHMIRGVYESGLVQKILDSANQKECYETILEIHGISNFLAYQIFVDLTYIPDFKFSENEFTISGPGCARGIDFLFEDKDGMTYEECIFWIRNNIERVFKENNLEYNTHELFDHLPEHDRCLNVMMIENSFCETSKMVKAKRGEGRPRNRYHAIKEQNKISKFLKK